MKEINLFLADLLAGITMGHQAVCGGKLQHYDEALAQEHADEIYAKYGGSRKGPYPCPWCLFWHVGKVIPKWQIYHLADLERSKHDRSIAAAAAESGDDHVQDGQGPPVVGTTEGPPEPEVPQDGLHGMVPRRDDGTLLEEDVARPWLLVLQPEESVGLGTKCGTGGMEQQAA